MGFGAGQFFFLAPGTKDAAETSGAGVAAAGTVTEYLNFHWTKAPSRFRSSAIAAMTRSTMSTWVSLQFSRSKRSEKSSGAAEHRLGLLTKPRKLPPIESDQGCRNHRRTGIINNLSHPPVALAENPLSISGSFREKHYLLTFKKLVENLAGPHIPLPADRKCTPGTVDPALKRLDEKLFLGRRPDHLKRISAEDGPGQKYRVVGRNMVGCEKNTSGRGDIPSSPLIVKRLSTEA